MDALGAYRQFQVRRGLLPSSITASRYILTRFATFLSCSLLVATTTDVEAFVDSRYHLAKTRYCVISNLRTFYRWAMTEGLVVDDPTARVVRPRLRHYVPRPIHDDDLALALAQASPVMYAWLTLAAFMGLRCQEIAHLRSEDIDTARGVLVVSMGKGHHQRVVPLNREVERALRMLVLPSRGYAFPRLDGRHHSPARVSQMTNNYLHGLGITATAHQLRHWFGTRIYAESHDLRMTQELLGHASPTTTAIYVQFSPGQASDVVRNLAV